MESQFHGYNDESYLKARKILRMLGKEDVHNDVDDDDEDYKDAGDEGSNCYDINQVCLYSSV